MALEHNYNDSWKYNVKAASTSHVDTEFTAFPIIDGYQTKMNDRVLLKDQNNPVENGIYNLNKNNMTLDTDSINRQAYEFGGCVRVTDGATNINTEWYLAPIEADLYNTTAKIFVPSPFGGTVYTGLNTGATGEGVFKDVANGDTFRFKKIKSTSMDVTSDANNVTIENGNTTVDISEDRKYMIINIGGAEFSVACNEIITGVPKAPTVVAQAGLSINIALPDLEVTISMKDALIYVEGGLMPYQYRLVSGALDSGWHNEPEQATITFDCSHVGGNLLELWVRGADDGGNSGIGASTTVQVQDNMALC